jgi:hypothetical protein
VPSVFDPAGPIIMSVDFQTIAALVVVAIAATWLIIRTFGKQRKPGCGGGCDCPTQELKR